MKRQTQIKRISVLLICFIVCTFVMPVWAESEVTVYLNGEKLDFDVPPQIINDRTMVPMRRIFEAIGAVVTWDEQTQTATGKKDDTVVNITIDSAILFKNGTPKLLDVSPVLIDGRTLVPVRAVAESFACQVDWIEESQSVMISFGDGTSIEKTKLTAQEISERVAPSVFYIEVSDAKGTPLGSGSGFFVSSDGVAVTNYHVIEETKGAKITTIYGEIHKVTEVIAFDADLDIAIIRVEKTAESGKTVSGFQPVVMANSDEVKAGQVVYALGSPVGLQNTISDGIISNARQVIDGDVFIQTTAPISHGSSGGALVNEYGEVVGITSAGIDEAQNIGFAIPINNVALFDLSAEGTAYGSLHGGSEFTLSVYPQTVELRVGESTNILVSAPGKDDSCSIYWKTDDERVLACEWVGRLKEDPDVYVLKVKAKKSGTAKVTVYSDVDFRGVDVTVAVSGSGMETYPSTRVSVPTYTTITGAPLIGQEDMDYSTSYTYRYDSPDTVQAYIDYLMRCGFVYYKTMEGDGYIGQIFITPEKEMVAVAIAYGIGQVWVLVPR